MKRAQRGTSLHIGIFGRRNSGKSSLINAITKQDCSIVSEVAGTTTDPVYKSMEILPVGPVVLIDTAGIDDLDNRLGHARVQRSNKVLAKTQFAILVLTANSQDFEFEKNLIAEFKQREIPYIVANNKIDLGKSSENLVWINSLGVPSADICAAEQSGIDELKELIRKHAPQEWEPSFMRDLFSPKDTVLLITPIDRGAPKGRMIMPQVKAIREVLDGNGILAVCTQFEVKETLQGLATKPVLAVTDSQVFEQVSKDVPADIPLTSFSILSIRQKGDLSQMIDGVEAIQNLKPNDRILIAESCTHHPMEDDIGRIKIPNWLKEHLGFDLRIDTVPGYDYPDDLSEYKLVVHCGGCTLNRKEVIRRQSIPDKLGVPMTNYGVLIAYLKGAFPRAIELFRENENNL